MNLALEAVASEDLNFNQYGKLAELVFQYDAEPSTMQFYTESAQHPEQFVDLVQEYLLKF